MTDQRPGLDLRSVAGTVGALGALNIGLGIGFGIGLLNKDIRLCMAEADALGVPMVVGSAVRQLLAIATSTEGADADMTAMARTVEAWAGVEIGRASST